MKAITLIMCGGTISSAYDGNIVRPGKVTSFKELEGRTVKVTAPFCVLSENMNYALLKRLGDCLQNEIDAGAEAVIITHGTDTLAYTAAYLGLRFAGIRIPVMIVSADYPLSNVESNGRHNFLCALRAIDESDVCGVFVPYCNRFERPLLHFSTRLLSSRDFDGGMNSAMGNVCGFIDPSGHFVLQEYPDPHPVELIERDAHKEVQFVYANPGLDWKALGENARKKGSAIVVAGYHTGSINTTENGICHLEGVDVYLTGGLSGEKYASHEALPAFVRSIDNIAPIALYTKVRLSYACFANEKERTTFLYTNIFNEFFR